MAGMSGDLSLAAQSGEGDIIFFGGDIVTVAAAQAEPEAVVVKDGIIVFAGGYQDALRLWQGPRTQLRDLQGRALLPGFIDAHGHLGGIGLQATIASLLAPPDGEVSDITALRDQLRAFADSAVGAESAWIVGFGYDDALLPGGHPTRKDLDAVSTARPVLAIHQSFHLGAVNSAGLAQLGYTAATKDPDGGVIRRWPDVEAPPYGEPNGVLEEAAFTPASDKAIAGLPMDALLTLFSKGAAAAASFGFTTVQEGGATLANLQVLRDTAAQQPFPIDVVGYAQAHEATRAPGDDPVGVSQEYVGGVRTAGVKMYLDGSPQGRTAWLTKPYATPPDGKDADYCGYPAIADDDVVLQQVRTAFGKGWQVLAHVNGDAAIDQFITAVNAATSETGPADRRVVAVHAQTAREDQIEAFQRLGIIPSFFSMHTFYWGDWYRDTVLGMPRAETISPARWALDRQMIYTSHHDAPVALPNSIAILSSQVTRITRSGYILGPGQRVAALDAVKSITINAACQYFEQDRKGSIEAGKLADLVILSASPLTIPPEEIKNITVTETIKQGTTVYPAASEGPRQGPRQGPRAPARYLWHGHC